MKLIGFILFVVVIFAFIGFNLDNRTDINIWINEKGHFEDVSVIIVVFAAYLFGLLSTVPFWFARSLTRRRSKERQKGKGESSPRQLENGGPGGEAPQKKTFLGSRKSRKKDDGE